MLCADVVCRCCVQMLSVQMLCADVVCRCCVQMISSGADDKFGCSELCEFILSSHKPTLRVGLCS